MDTMEDEPETALFGGYIALRITNIVVCSVVVLLCGVLVVSMTLPLLSPKRRKNYSTYNLYLAYLAIPDGVIAGNVLCLALVHRRIDPLLMDRINIAHSINIVCGASNMYTNAFLTYEIYRLLKHSSLRKRHQPPTVARVTTQALLSYGMGITIAVVDLVVRRNVGTLDYHWLDIAEFVFVAIIPLSCMVGITARIWYQQLLRTKGSMYGGKLRILILYFSRIVLTDLMFWLPCSTMYVVFMMSYQRASGSGVDVDVDYQRRTTLARNVSLLLHGVQTTVNFGFSLTKPDARKLIADVFRCACFRGGGVADDPIDLQRYGDPTLRASCLSTAVMAVPPSAAPAYTDRNALRDEGDSSDTTADEVANNGAETTPSRAPQEPTTLRDV